MISDGFRLKHKHLLLKLIEKFTPNSPIGVEIGVDRCDTTIYLLENSLNLKHLYAVDPYINRKSRLEIVKKQLEPYSNCTFINSTSSDAANIIPNELDFIFIDGDHSYEAVLSDLQNYVPKIRSGGLLTGHDWTQVRENLGVVDAGEKYLSENENLFNPLFSNDQLIEMGLEDFKRSGWSKRLKRPLIHKKIPSDFPLWWLIKK